MAIFKLRLLADEDQEEVRLREELDEERPTRLPADRPAPLAWYWTVAVAIGAALPRLYTLFFLTDPENAGDGWHGDVYHHWQIAYLTKEIGLWAAGGPRLWDLKGLDYFWGILHPTLLVLLFYITGSIDIVLARLLTIAFSTLVVVLIFHLCLRYWNLQVAVAAAAFAAFAPTSVFVDSTGFLEPIGVALCLLGIWLSPRRGFWAGMALGLAAMARAEAWVFSAGIVVASFLRRQVGPQRLAMVAAWVALMLLYMKILLDRTGNPIYPVWWNFLANAYGKWEFRVQLSPAQLTVRPLLGALLVGAAVGLAVTLWKRPPAYMFLTYGFGYLVFTGGVLGFTAYLKSWESWFWMERFFVFPYEFGAILVSVALFVLAPRWLGRPARFVAPVLALAMLLAVQLEWTPILELYRGTTPTWVNAVQAGRDLGADYNQPQYRGGTLNIPAGNPDVTYTLARYGNVPGHDLVGQLYDPFYYLPAGYTYRDHPDTAGTLMQCWLTQTRTKVWAINPQSENYTRFVTDHPGWFRQIGILPNFGWYVEEVDVPGPSEKACSAAGKAARS